MLAATLDASFLESKLPGKRAIRAVEKKIRVGQDFLCCLTL